MTDGIGVRASLDLGGGDFLARKNDATPEGVGDWGLKSGCKRRRSPFSHLMKLLSLEK